MAQHIAQKLRLTSALLGTVTRKDLAAAFRSVNARTAFDLGRADKWLQGRAHPRELSVYEDWAKLLRLEQPGAWIAESDLPSFTAAICARHGVDRVALERHAAQQFEAASAHDDRAHSIALIGSYACYSRAWSPYYRGQLIKGSLSIEGGPGVHGLTARYREALPTGQLVLGGPVTPAKRGLYIHVREAGGDAQFFFSLFPQSQPGSVLGGYMCGTAIIGPEAQPSFTRIIMVRLRDPVPGATEWGGYLLPQGSVATDLAALGIAIEHPEVIDRLLGRFLGADGEGDVGQIPPAEFRAILDVFDRRWLQHAG
ncbi:MAG: hypothetical protein EOQ50_10230 [Mesorhizobium sp.]|uniref:hypothetical protein n=1 Tax=Mesorhizobium sp. TaxID=1871066 RepID=UPI000FE60203|nr:hypothetical protein [Mesorhizobium sp.]RWB77270.1 MAG: hypothetical protein EOQ50_10230 [Mesorhizobium sp.]RWL83613.1 MAG: hypothetical protein EOR69_12770 [Mesorhizobium sp.]RWL90764.1 MAG: hypothetical protein EOR67_05110 [Mesorhizobium sp.]RWL92662.1 MAG: hypothetical protein EOR68_25755 [Mesorhizobium sp.]RWL93251.1 MAG: hypothetical protein EOR70_28780 [Mesorhizobium sp.]